jgi:hypothetical protein
MAKVTAKRKCCKDKPRCSACPVVLKRLSDAGFAERLDLRTYKLTGKPKKAVRAAARAR